MKYINSNYIHDFTPETHFPAPIRFEPPNYSKRDTTAGYGIRTRAIKYELLHLKDGKAGSKTPIALPDKVLAGNPMWSPNGERFAFMNVTPSEVQLWVGDSEIGKIKHNQFSPLILAMEQYFLK